ncbi:T9SS type A sorting domain-containing protein [Aquimarina aggregata]
MMGEVYIDFKNQISKASYKIFDKKGKVVKESKKLIQRNTISLKALPTGIYTVRVKNKNKVMTKKLLRL